MENTFDLFRTDVATSVDLIELFISLCVGFVLSIVIVTHYNNVSSGLSERRHFSRTFPLILLITLVVISVVKSSLALSLGLVGALSIVRFRTPVKEPEDLAYLFLCIAVGVGLGAGVILATVVATLFILIAVSIYLRSSAKETPGSHWLTIVSQNKSNPGDLNEVLTLLDEFTVEKPKIRRIEYLRDGFETLIQVSTEDDQSTASMIAALKSNWPSDEITLLDQSRTPLS